MAELQTERFEVGVFDLGEEGEEYAAHFYDKTDTEQYGWMVGAAGELIIFRVEKHATFGAVLSDERYYCYAPGSWEYVAVLKDEPEEKQAVIV